MQSRVLRKHLIEQAARASTASTVIPRDPGVINPLMRRYGTYGWVVTLTGSVESFHVAAQMVGQLQRVSTRPCPIAIMLVGNKQDQYGGRRMIVPRAEIFDLIRQGSAQDALVAQMRKQKLDRPPQDLTCDHLAVHQVGRTGWIDPWRMALKCIACISHTGPPCISQVRLRRGVGRSQGLLGAASLMEHARKPLAPGGDVRFELLGGSVAPPGFVKQTGVDEEEYRHPGSQGAAGAYVEEPGEGCAARRVRRVE